MSKIEIINGDSLKIVRGLPMAKMIFADPPDNLGKKYDGFDDNKSAMSYRTWLSVLICAARYCSEIFWLSYFYKYQPAVLSQCLLTCEWRQFIWRFTFGQAQQTDCTSGYRPIMRWNQPAAVFYPDAIRVPSDRQIKYNDKRASAKGKMPDDVWEFPRVCGTFKERRAWHPTQHPEALMERIIKFSCVPGDLVIDMFAGTGTTLRVCKRLGIDCIGIEQSKLYCDKMHEELFGAT